MANESNSSDAFRRAVIEYLEAVDAGVVVDQQEFLARHSDVQEKLREFLEGQDEVAKAAAQPPASAGASADEPTLPGALGSTADAPTLDSHAPLNRSVAQPARERIGYFGDYELLTEIARGGMGVVYKARQANLDRVVALKMILAGQLASPDDVRRFYQEAEAAANLQHPGIVPIYEVGLHEEQHFFSMAFVDGPSLAQVVAEGPLPPKEAAGIVKHVAEAMAYAHSKGVVHRDLKPANVLLARIDGRTHAGSAHGVTLGGSPENPGRRGVYEPKVTDFGLAKRTEGDSELTGTGQILGTPAYMPPEQASGQVKQIGPLADVYSLGAILYCLLTGRPPFQAASVMDTLMQVLEKEPLPPRDLNPQVPRDLETIALKCLHKDRQKRYGSAQALADELGRYLQGAPILARPVGRIERAAKWVRRYPVVAGLLLLVALSLVIGTTVSTLFAIEANQRAAAESAAKEFAKKQEGLAKARERDATRAKQAEEQHRRLAEERERDALTAQANESAQRKRAELREKEALWHLYVARMFPMMDAWTKRDFGQLEHLLAQSTPGAGEPDFRGWEWHYFQDQCRQASRAIEPGSPCAGGVAWNAKTGEIAIATKAGTIEIRDEGGAKTRTLKPKHRPIYQLAWSADGKLACGAKMSSWSGMPSPANLGLNSRTIPGLYLRWLGPPTGNALHPQETTSKSGSGTAMGLPSAPSRSKRKLVRTTSGIWIGVRTEFTWPRRKKAAGAPCGIRKRGSL
jgi:serine/threonine protein kinase